MQYRDALDSSKNCPKCCSQTLERFLKKSVKAESENIPKIEKQYTENNIDKKKLQK